MKVIGYTRVSTLDQAESGLGLEAQRDTIQRYADAHGWEVEWFTDEGASGKTLDRPGLQAALEVLRAKRADALVVAKLDRLSRSMQDFTNTLADARKQKWALIAVDLGLDTTTSTGRLVANIMASVAEWERDVISDRTSAAMRALAARGVHVGRPRSLPATSEARLHELRAEGLTLAATAEALNAEGVPTAHGGRWHASTVARIAKRQPKPSTRTVRAA